MLLGGEVARVISDQRAAQVAEETVAMAWHSVFLVQKYITVEEVAEQYLTFCQMDLRDLEGLEVEAAEHFFRRAFT